MKKQFVYFFVLCVFSVGAMAQKTVSLERYAEVPYAVGNIAFTHQGELVYSNHPFYNPEIRVMRYHAKTKKATPFPNEDWNTPKKENQNFLSSVLGIRNDTKGIVWMLDMGFRDHITPKFVGWNTVTNRLHKIYEVPAPASLPTSQLNDFVIDEKRNVFVIADEDIAPGGDGSHGALVILDMHTGKARRLLDGHYSTVPENIPLIFNGLSLNIPNTAKPILVGADGITLDKNNEWLYYAPLNGTKIYRIKMDDLVDVSLSATQLAEKVEVYSTKENNGGLSIDVAGNLYLTYLERNGIGVIPVQGRESYIYTQDEGLIWPDGVSYNRDGYMYSSAAQLHLAKVFNNGVDKTTGHFYIYRFKPLVEGIFGR